MVGHVPHLLGPAVDGVEVGVGGVEGAQAAGGPQGAADAADHPGGLLPGQGSEGHRDGPDLVAAQLGVGGGGLGADDILQPPGLRHPEGPAEALARLVGQGVVGRAVRPGQGGEAGHDPQGVVPVGVDLHRLAVAGGGQDGPDPHVHPGHLVQALAGAQKAVGVPMDAVACAGPVAVDDADGAGPDLPDKGVVPGAGMVEPQAVQEEQGGVRRVVLGRGVLVGEEVGQQAVLFVGGKSAQDALCVPVAAGGEGAAGQGDHGVPAPVGEEGVAGHDGLAAGGGPVHDVGVGRRRKGPAQFAVEAGGPGLGPAALGLPGQDDGGLGQAGPGAEHDGEGLGLAGGRLKEELPGRSAQAGGGPAVGGVVAEADALVPGPGQRLGPAPLQGKVQVQPAAGDPAFLPGKGALPGHPAALGDEPQPGGDGEEGGLGRAVFHRVADGHRVGAVLHGHPAGDPDSPGLVDPAGARPVEQDQVAPAVLIGAIGLVLGGKADAGAAGGEGLGQAVDQVKAGGGGPQAGHQEGVVPPGGGKGGGKGAVGPGAGRQQEGLLLGVRAGKILPAKDIVHSHLS